MKVAIGGSRGLIGRSVARLLTSEGHEIVMLYRDRSELFVNLPDSVDAVINLGGETIMGRWTEEKRNRIQQSRVDVTKQLVDWAASLRKPPAVFLSASAVGFYGHRPGEVLDENSSGDPKRKFRYRVCWRWEQEALKLDGTSRVATLRFGNVLSQEGGYLREIMKKFRYAWPCYLGNPRRHVPWISLQDAARMVSFALTNEGMSGPVNVVAPSPATHKGLMDLVGTMLRRPPFISIPEALVRMRLGEMADALLDDQRVEPSVASRLGFRWNEPDLEALQERLSGISTLRDSLSTARD